jgi:hypothetical protein
MNVPKKRTEIFELLNSHTADRKGELHEKRLTAGLVKTYLIETVPPSHPSALHSHQGEQTPLENYFQLTSWTLKQTDDTMYHVYHEREFLGFLERVFGRFCAFYTKEYSRKVDDIVEKNIRSSALLDNVWFAGTFFNQIWDLIIAPQDVHQFVKFRFEHDNRFEYGTSERNQNNEVEGEPRLSSREITDQLKNVAKDLHEYRKINPLFYAPSLMRIPSMTGQGGHEFYYFGKVTNRSDSFHNHRATIKDYLSVYHSATEKIEEVAWLDFEKTNVSSGGVSYSLVGAPILIKFSSELSVPMFRRFITHTFINGKGPFRLWGDPIWLGDKRVHIYGADMHLWQELYLEITTKHFLLILPKGSCGNTVHRLITNIQRFLSPNVNAMIGHTSYQDLITKAIELPPTHQDSRGAIHANSE